MRTVGFQEVAYVEAIESLANIHVHVQVFAIIRASGQLSLRAKFVGPTWGPPGARRTQVGPMLAIWNLLPGKLNCNSHSFTCVHMTTCAYVHIWVHVRGCVLNCYMIFIVDILSAYGYVATCFRLYISKCMNIFHICDNALLYDMYSTNHHDHAWY